MKLQGRFKKIFIYSFLALYVTGLIVWLMQKFLSHDYGMGLESPPSRIWILKAHAVVSFAFLIVFGYFIRVHIQPGLKGVERKRGGLFNLAILGFLTLTVPFILYAVDENFKNLVTGLHTYVGLAFILPYLFHQKKKAAAKSSEFK